MIDKIIFADESISYGTSAGDTFDRLIDENPNKIFIKINADKGLTENFRKFDEIINDVENEYVIFTNNYDILSQVNGVDDEGNCKVYFHDTNSGEVINFTFFDDGEGKEWDNSTNMGTVYVKIVKKNLKKAKQEVKTL